MFTHLATYHFERHRKAVVSGDLLNALLTQRAIERYYAMMGGCGFVIVHGA